MQILNEILYFKENLYMAFENVTLDFLEVCFYSLLLH